MNRFTHRLAVVAGTAVTTACLVLAGALPAVLSGTASAAPGTPPAATAQAAAVSVTRAASPAYVAPTRTLSYGMRGSDVKALQRRLAALKYYRDRPTGSSDRTPSRRSGRSRRSST